MVFLIDKYNSYSYEELLDEINSKNYYYPFYQTTDLFLFYSNLLLAVLNNLPITLIDSDVSNSELTDRVKDKLNKKNKLIINKGDFTVEDLIIACFNSTSKITLFTSGTTGQPKAVAHTIQTLTRNVKKGIRYHDQVWGLAYSPTHMAGTQVFFQALANKNTLVNIFNFSRYDVYYAINNYDITHISATPTFYRLLLPYENEYPKVKRITFGGEKSDNNLYRIIEKIFPNAKLNNIYASTEAGTIFSSKGDVFQIHINDKEKIKILNKELLLHKSLLGEGLISNQLDSDDFYHTGDLIEWVQEQEGTFIFKSRKNELINIGGNKVNPNEVEEEIRAVDGIKQVIVYGKANSVLGNILCADIVKMNEEVTELYVRTNLTGKLQDYKIPRRIKFVENIEVTRTGKTKRK